MSNKNSQDEETKLMPPEEVQKKLDSLANAETMHYSTDNDSDVLAVFYIDPTEGVLVIVPNSERAISFFTEHLGYDPTMSGIEPPEVADDILNSLPLDYTIEHVESKQGLHRIQKIPLPQELPVVH